MFTECLQGWERGSHGTGMGHTTNKGFWIPEKPVALPQEEMLALPEPPRGRGAGGRPPKKHRAPAAFKAPKGPGRQPKAIKLEETDQESQDEEPPVVWNQIICCWSLLWCSRCQTSWCCVTSKIHHKLSVQLSHIQNSWARGNSHTPLTRCWYNVLAGKPPICPKRCC